nr:hypothetical protein [Enterobacter roggenkampii]
MTDPTLMTFGPWVPIVQHPVTTLRSASWLKANLTAVPDGSGVYAFYVRAGTALPNSFPVEATSTNEAVTIYVGKTGDSLRRRLKQHLLGDARVSQLKANLGVLVQNALGLSVLPIPGNATTCLPTSALSTTGSLIMSSWDIV